MCYSAEFGRSRLNDTNVIKEIHLKISPLAFTLSRTLNVNGTDTFVAEHFSLDLFIYLQIQQITLNISPDCSRCLTFAKR